MHFDLIQSLSLAGSSSTPNDDRAGSARAHAWVIDGATDLGPPGLVGEQGGAAWLASVAQAAFAGSAGESIDTIYDDVISHILDAWERDRTREPEGRWELPLASALAVYVGEGRLACAWYGDCVALLRRGDAVSRLGPFQAERMPETALATSLAEHGLGSPKRSAPILENLRAGRGAPGKRVLSVDPEHMTVLDGADMPCAPGDELILMSDGYAALIDDYGAFDETGLFEAIRARGLAAVAEELRAIEAADIACTRFPRFKTSDDATALWLRIGG